MYSQSRNHHYRGSAFFLAKAVADVPVTLVRSLLASAIIPTLAGFQLSGDRWVYFYLAHVVLSLAALNLVKAVVFLGSSMFDG